MKILHWMKEELIRVIPAIIYFCIAFNLIHFTSGLTLKPDDVRYFDELGVNLGALVVGKVMLFVDSFSFLNLFPNKPLIYNIIWKSAVYCFFVFLTWFNETLFHLTYKYDNFSEAFKHLFHELHSPVVWATLLWLIVTFLIFVIASEFINALGKDKVEQMLFGKKIKR